MYLVSSNAAVNMAYDYIEKNGKTHIAVKAVKVKLNIEKFRIRLNSELHSPIINNIINEATNKECRSIYIKIQSEIESYTGKIVQLIMSSIAEKMAIEDFFQ